MDSILDEFESRAAWMIYCTKANHCFSFSEHNIVIYPTKAVHNSGVMEVLSQNLFLNLLIDLV